eukprot:SAG22_NODE_575_length_8991_cov_12.134859_16_plen_126_part_00
MLIRWPCRRWFGCLRWYLLVLACWPSAAVSRTCRKQSSQARSILPKNSTVLANNVNKSTTCSDNSTRRRFLEGEQKPERNYTGCLEAVRGHGIHCLSAPTDAECLAVSCTGSQPAASSNARQLFM